jgi:hypothetical protein
MKKILGLGLIILFFILPTFACAVNAESNTNEIKIYDVLTTEIASSRRVYLNPAVNQATSDDNQTELIVQSIIGGGFGKITANIENNGSTAANDVFIKMIVTGGIFHRVNKSAAWGLISIPEQGVASFAIKHFFGLGKITIVVVARALNAPDVSKTVTAILLGSYSYIAK